MSRALVLSMVLLAGLLQLPRVAAQPEQEDAAKPPAPEVLVRTSLSDSRGDSLSVGQTVTTGERVTLVIDVLTSTWFSGAPEYQHLKIPGAVAQTRSEFVSNLSEQIDGKTFSGLRREFVIFAQRPGQMVIPGLTIKASPITQAGGTAVTRTVVRSQPKLLRVEALAGVPSRQAAPLVAESVDMQQALTQPNDRWHVGDILERRVTIRAEGSLGMLIPALTWPPVRGLRQQSLPEQVSDNMARGAFTGTRTEVRRYTLQQPGHFTLPSLSLDWWDGEAWQQAELPAQEIQVAPANGASIKPASDGLAKRLMRWLAAPLSWFVLALVALALAALGWGLWWARQRGHDWHPQALSRRWSQREAVAYRQLRRHVRSGQADAIVAAFYRWRQIALQELGPAYVDETFEQLWGEIYPLALQAQGVRLSSTQQTALQSQLNRLRRRWRGDAERQSPFSPLSTTLVPLNPSATDPS